MEFLVRTPLWVWPLLALVVALGLMQLRDRQVTAARVLMLPVVMIGMSITSTIGTFGLRPDVLGAWGLAATTVAAMLAWARWPSGIERLPHGGGYLIPGSIVPLLLILATFALRFLIGATGGIAPQRLTDPVFAITVCTLLGLVSGAFLARAVRVLITQPVPRSTPVTG
ncbi:MAG: hypothetical protein EKK41_19100 [Hyphomicrobiales bacterium]|nr:MAG: hypothetical protein EKK41_19100 [Hyphomicrobiales bacterium]